VRIPAEPVFSPDGQSVAFWSDGALKRIPVTGGTPVRLSAADTPFGASWEDGRILLGQLTPRGIVEIPENGGAAKLVVTLDEKAGEEARSPQLVAGGRWVLFTLRTGRAAWDDASIVVQELATGRRKVLLQGGTDARVLPTGHLVYANASTIFAMPLDETTLAVTGGSVPVQQRIEKLSYRAVQAVWSASGTLVLAHGVPEYYSALVWVDRQDKQERTALPLRNYGVGSSEIRLSPDGTRVAATVFADEVLNFAGTATSTRTAASAVWAGDMTRGTLTRLSKTGQATSPVWTPDGQRVCYDSGGEAFCQPADGRAATAATLFKVEGLVNTRAFARDGSRMVLETRGPKTGNDITIATMGPPVETRPLLNTVHSESAPAISPDGRWLAYQSDDSGRAEVYVRPFPAVDQGLWQISTGGGGEPRWAPNGRELFFTVRSGGWTTPGVLMSLPVQTGSTFIARKPAPVLKIPAEASEAYDVAPDGRFLLHLQGLKPVGEEAQRPAIVVVQNWFEELKARVPARTAK
jgi:serine/threonine-protein kinase